MQNILNDLPYSDHMRMLIEIHTSLNKMLFDGRLKPIKMDICNIHDSNIDGELNAVYRQRMITLPGVPDRCILIDNLFVTDILPKAGDATDQMLLLMETVLHEMVHQYCDENGEDDQNHCGAWSEVANKHGLYVEIWDEEHDDYLQELDPKYSAEFEAISRELLSVYHSI